MKIIKYGAEWCGPCRTLSKLLKNSGYSYEEIDIDEHPEFINQKHIASIPVIEIIGDNNEILFTHRGFMSKEDLDIAINNLNL